MQAIDWSAPWLQPWRGIGEPIAAHLQHGMGCADALNTGAPVDLPKRFVAQAALPAGMAYEQFIFDTHAVPTRDNVHDFFNGLCWMRFPQTKQRLNLLQATQIAQDGVQATRGKVRDALTVFDENAAFLHAPDALWQALVAKDWHRLFITLRPLWAQAQVLLFGHALLEKLCAPRKAITAHVYRVQAPGVSLADVAVWDAWVAQYLQVDTLLTKPFAHLPILGVPGWHPPNEHAAFYADTSVFRPPRPPTLLP